MVWFLPTVDRCFDVIFVEADKPKRGAMKSLIAVAALAAWTPAMRSRRAGLIAGIRRSSAPAPLTRNPGTRSQGSRMPTLPPLIAVAAKHHKHPAAGIETIYSARYSDDDAKVLIFAFNKKNCLVDRGAIPIDEWEKVFGAAT